MTDQPFFRFYPNAYAEGGPFEKSDEECGVCARPAGWLFTGVIYHESDDDPNVCARCIAEGGLSKVAPGYTLHDMQFADAPDAAMAEEIEQRTPGFATWNAFEWPVREGKPLAFMGYGSDPSLRTAEALAAIAEVFADFSLEDADPSHALLFKTLDGDAYVAVLDLD